MEEISLDSPLCLLHYVVEEINLKALPPEEEISEIEQVLKTQLQIGSTPDNNVRQVKLTIEILPQSEKIKFNLCLKLVGIFGVKLKEEEEINALLSREAFPILYGVARELIMTLTSKTVYPPYLLPFVNFSVDAKKENVTGEASKK